MVRTRRAMQGVGVTPSAGPLQDPQHRDGLFAGEPIITWALFMVWVPHVLGRCVSPDILHPAGDVLLDRSCRRPQKHRAGCSGPHEVGAD